MTEQNQPEENQPEQPADNTPPPPPPPAYGQPQDQSQAPAPYQPSPPHQMGPQQAGPATSDEKTWGMLAHLSPILLGFLGPLLVMLIKGDESPGWTRPQAVEALNFQLTMLIAFFVSGLSIIVLIGLLLFPIVAIANVVFIIIGTIKANNGEMYRYPINFRMVK